MPFTRKPGSGGPRQTSRREDHNIVINARVQRTASSAAIQAQVAPSLGAPASSRIIRRRLAEGHLGSRRPLREWNQVVFSDESRFKLSIDDNHVRLWRPRGERLNPAFSLQLLIAVTVGVMVWGVIAYNTQSPLVFIRGAMTAQQYGHNILPPHVLPLMQRLPGAIFHQYNVRNHMARLSEDCLPNVTTLPLPARSPDLFPIEHIWDHLGRRVGGPTSLNELEARLQQIRNEMSQDIIQSLYASMLDRIASCIHATGGSTGY
ncbi:transposable element Tcb2 transposase [Trichonephila clavipes]|uniref:Transposable element Tcb2 transposase n=1 Tax=Trichonephila clavipes TaxID=2585209 RepID=A0A8X7B989_TRICX|nr:transposable element Tcb2 transposase [Trichonephila clavipes]